ncbi:MAG TPA: hypothetical protein VMM13_19660 [Euzebya sp.]|nr:hypothetical protein [Euzebya sp.]
MGPAPPAVSVVAIDEECMIARQTAADIGVPSTRSEGTTNM